MRGIKGLAYALPLVKKCKLLLDSSWRGRVHNGRGGEVHGAGSEILYSLDRTTAHLFCPKNRSHNVNDIVEKRGLFGVHSPSLAQLEKELQEDKVDITDMGLFSPTVKVMGDVMPMSGFEFNSKLRGRIAQEQLSISRAGWALHGIMNSSTTGAITRSSNLLKVMKDDAYDLHKFEISSCNYIDVKGKKHQIDIDELRRCKEDLLSPYADKIIDGINRVAGRRLALRCILVELLKKPVVNIPNDLYLLSIDQNGVDVLAEYLDMRTGTKDKSKWKEYRIEFQDEVSDIVAFCQLLIDLEDQLIIPKSLQRSYRTQSGIYVPYGNNDLNGLLSSKGFPPYLDWSERVSKVPEVMHQGEFDTCWALTVGTAAEYRHLIDTGDYIRLSAQQIIDHAEKGSSHPLHAFKYILKKGLASSDSYKYVGRRCRKKKFQPVVKIKGISGWVDLETRQWRSINPITTFHPIDIIEELQHGPCVVNMHAGEEFALYDQDVDVYSCDSLQDCDHAVLCLGYDFRDGCNLNWKLQNSWGPTWGHDGYMKCRDWQRDARERCFGDYFLYSFGDMCLRPI